MQHPKQIGLCFILNRVPIEFPNKNFFIGKLESVWYNINRRDLFLNGTSEGRCHWFESNMAHQILLMIP
jgi:hypothetical protein